MNEMNIDVSIGYLQDVLGKLSKKHFIAKQDLDLFEQNLLNDLFTLAMHAHHKEIIRKHFSTK